ncbi:MAG: hypothetical protein GY757_35270 [bacterium]|nr:hypothetical protein [bacterium]
MIYVNGIDLANGTHPETVNIGIRHQLKANIYAPNGTIFLKSRGVAEGGFIGKDVLIDFYVQVTRNSIFE